VVDNFSRSPECGGDLAIPITGRDGKNRFHFGLPECLQNLVFLGTRYDTPTFRRQANGTQVP
jgi:hypothetical protein